MVIPFLKVPSIVIAYLKEPRARYWGMLRSLDATGIVMQGIDLDSFDEWVRQVADGQDAPQLSTAFFPLLRVEKVLLDAPSGPIPALHEHFRRRVGRSLEEFLGVGS